MRHTLSAVPLKKPYFWYASRAYSEQVGVNLQQGYLFNPEIKYL
jgi:hypothetical protein